MVVDLWTIAVECGAAVGGRGVARNLQVGCHISTNRSRQGWRRLGRAAMSLPEWREDRPVVVVDEDMTSSPLRGCQNSRRAGPPAVTAKQ
jgi:hypothetical protein